MTNPSSSSSIHHETTALTAIDGVKVSAFVARPEASPKGCVVVVQEIFGVNAYVRAVCDRWAQAGWLAVAPAFFDRIETGIEMGYDANTMSRGIALVDQLGFDATLRDIDAARHQIGHGLPCGVVGFCWGGTVAALAATRMGLAAVSYYGGRTRDQLHERPQAALLMHFGELDPMIPAPTVAQIEDVFGKASAHTGHAFTLHRYPAGHGFNRYGHPDYHVASADLAQARSEAFLAQHAK
jgi:carboxymethylenebutenolidase